MKIPKDIDTGPGDGPLGGTPTKIDDTLVLKIIKDGLEASASKENEKQDEDTSVVDASQLPLILHSNEVCISWGANRFWT